MKILYRQNSGNEEKCQKISPFSAFGINNCYFKWIKQGLSDENHTKKQHSHTGYEFHIVVGGRQCYETSDGVFSVDSGYFLAVPKGKTHKLVSGEYPIEKYAVTFLLGEHSKNVFNGLKSAKCKCLPIPESVLSNIRAMSGYSGDASRSSEIFIENYVFEIAILLLRAIGVTEKSVTPPNFDEKTEDGRIELARQFILDNIELPLQVNEVAAYCYISEKQLTRLFSTFEKTSPAIYIRRERVKHIEELLQISEIPLGEISQRMGFPNESGFNIFFKKYNGMPPGEYRKMITNGKD